jgi:hypothetical protein
MIDVEAAAGAAQLAEMAPRIAHLSAVADLAVARSRVAAARGSWEGWLDAHQWARRAEQRRARDEARLMRKHGASWAHASTDPGRS